MSQELLEVVEVAVIGAGASGDGVGVALKDFGIQKFALLERHKIGASFARWPAEMRFITPSFTSTISLGNLISIRLVCRPHRLSPCTRNI